MKFFKKLVDNQDSSANSKIFSAMIILLLIIAVVIADLLGVDTSDNMLYTLCGTLLGLLGITALPSKK